MVSIPMHTYPRCDFRCALDERLLAQTGTSLPRLGLLRRTGDVLDAIHHDSDCPSRKILAPPTCLPAALQLPAVLRLLEATPLQPISVLHAQLLPPWRRFLPAQLDDRSVLCWYVRVP